MIRNDPISREPILVFKWVVQHPTTDHNDSPQKKNRYVLLIEEILHQEVDSLSNYLLGFIHPRWWSPDFFHQQYGCQTKTRGVFTPKMDGENNGKPENPIKIPWIWGVFPYFWVDTHMNMLGFLDAFLVWKPPQGGACSLRHQKHGKTLKVWVGPFFGLRPSREKPAETFRDHGIW